MYHCSSKNYHLRFQFSVLIHMVNSIHLEKFGVQYFAQKTK